MKVKGWKSIYHANGGEKKAEVTILISDKIAFKTNTVTRDEKRTLYNIKGTIQQNVTIVNIYALKMEAPKFINLLITNIKEITNSNTIAGGDFNTSLT